MSLDQNEDKSAQSFPSPPADFAAGPPDLPSEVKIKRHPKKRKPANKPGPVPVSSEEKKNRKQLRLEKRTAYVKSLEESGDISNIESKKFLGETYKTRLEADAKALREECEATADDYDLREKSKSDLMHFHEVRKNMIEDVGGQGVSILSIEEMKNILSHLSTGMGRAAACIQLHIPYARFLNSFKYDLIFQQDVLTLEKSLIGLCEMHIFSAAMNGDVGSAEKFIRLKSSQREAIFSRKLSLAEHRMRKAAADAALGAINQDFRPDFTCLNNDELADYERIITKVAGGEDLDSHDAARLGEYQAKLIKANSPTSISK